MPRTPRINDLVGLLEEMGLDSVIDHGDEIGARCPNHGKDEQHPRHWFINKYSLKHQCFSCHYRGDLMGLVVKVTGKNAWDAARYIRENGLSIEALTTFDTDKDEAPEVSRETLVEQMGGFTYPPDRALKKRGFSLAAARDLGVAWDPEISAWVLPINGPDGELWGWQKKTADFVSNHPRKIKKQDTLFGLHMINNTDATFVVESPLDVAYLYDFEIQAVSIFGSVLSNKQLRILVERCSSLVLAFDNDKPGINETRRLIEQVRIHKRIPTWVLNYEGLGEVDPGEMSYEEIVKAYETAIFAPFYVPR